MHEGTAEDTEHGDHDSLRPGEVVEVDESQGLDDLNKVV